LPEDQFSVNLSTAVYWHQSMKKLFLATVLTCITCLCFGQKSLIGFEDLQYLAGNNLNRADTFLLAKGFSVKAKNEKKRTREYTLRLKDGSFVNVNFRADGRRLFFELETNSIEQYDLVRNSISQYIHKADNIGDVQTFAVKDLGNIYITVNDTQPYNPLRRNYIMQIVPDKSITAYD
jgi:hypothetical protein